jgi:hypothetical protein
MTRSPQTHALLLKLVKAHIDLSYACQFSATVGKRLVLCILHRPTRSRGAP